MLERDANGELLFPIRSEPGRNFYAGYLPEGCQVLIGRSIYGDMIVAVFDGGGNLRRVIREDYPASPVRGTSGTKREVDDEQFQEYLAGKLGFEPALIRIKEFRMPQDRFAVYHLPQHYHEFLNNPHNLIFDDEVREVLPGLIRQWHEWGQFVLEWGNDYWLDSTGQVVAS
jgi:hypothetical protein